MKTRQFAAHDMWGWFSSGTHLRKHVVFFAALLLSILICSGVGTFSVSALTDEEDAAQTNETIISETQTDDQKTTIQTEEKQNALRGEPQTSHFLYQTGISALCFDYTGRKKEALFLYRRKKSLILIATAQRCSISLIFQNLVNLFFFID